MTSTSEQRIAALASKLDEAVRTVGDTERCERIKGVVSAHVGRGDCPLDAALLTPVAGALIPPLEYHTIHNPGATTSATIHVYGGEIAKCNVFVQQEKGCRQEVRQLTYTD